MNVDGVTVNAQMIPELCKLTGNHRTTVSRWIEKGRLPPAIHRLLRILQNGDLGEISEQWSGWRLHPRLGQLFSPNDPYRGFEPGHLHALGWTHHLKGELRRDNVDLREQCEAQAARIRELEGYLEAYASQNVVAWTGRRRRTP